MMIYMESLGSFRLYSLKKKKLGSFGKVHGGVPVASGSFPTTEQGFSSPMHFGGSSLTTGKVLEHDGGSSNKLADAGKLAQVLNFSHYSLRRWCVISVCVCTGL